MKKKNGTGHNSKQLYSALFFINCVHFIDYSPFLYSNSPHSPSFPIPSHVFFSSKSNHARSPKIPLLQNPKPENPLVLSQCSTPFAKPSSSFPYKKINAHPASPKTPPFQNFRLFHFPAEFSQFSFPPHPFSPQKQKRINPFGFILFVSLILESVYKFQISFWGS